MLKLINIMKTFIKKILPFNFDRRIKSDLLIIPKILFGDQL
tara:strand:+ start:10439 stop:10561 length:123 start_codon:yes stop_codon:yes gene_type:complete